MEAGGVEPPSRDPTAWALRAYSPFAFRPRRARRQLDEGYPGVMCPSALTGVGPRPARYLTPLLRSRASRRGTGRSIRRPEPTQRRHLLCSPIFYEARDLGSLPRRPTIPVEAVSPPFNVPPIEILILFLGSMDSVPEDLVPRIVFQKIWRPRKRGHEVRGASPPSRRGLIALTHPLDPLLPVSCCHGFHSHGWESTSRALSESCRRSAELAAF